MKSFNINVVVDRNFDVGTPKPKTAQAYWARACVRGAQEHRERYGNKEPRDPRATRGGVGRGHCADGFGSSTKYAVKDALEKLSGRIR